MDNMEQECDRLVAQTQGNLLIALNIATRDLMQQRFICGIIKRAQKAARKQGINYTLTEGEKEVFARAVWLEQAHEIINNRFAQQVETN